MNWRTPLTTLAALACLAATGCGWNSYAQTEINVKYTSDNLVHVALLPSTMPDGESAAEARAELLEKLGEQADSWALVPGMQGAVRVEKDGPPVQVRGEMLMVEGPQEVGMVIWRSLTDDFDVARPWLVSLPTQAVLFIPAPPAGDEEAEPAGDTPTAMEAE